MANNRYRAYTYNALCDSCGFKYKSIHLKKRWDNLMVCAGCWETRQPQDFVRAVRETSTTLPWVRSVDLGDNAIAPFATPGYVNDGYWEEQYTP